MESEAPADMGSARHRHEAQPEQVSAENSIQLAELHRQIRAVQTPDQAVVAQKQQGPQALAPSVPVGCPVTPAKVLRPVTGGGGPPPPPPEPTSVAAPASDHGDGRSSDLDTYRRNCRAITVAASRWIRRSSQESL